MYKKQIFFVVILLFSFINLSCYKFTIVNMTGESLKKIPNLSSGNQVTLIYRGDCIVDSVELGIGESKVIDSSGCCLKDIAIGGITFAKSTDIFSKFPAKQYVLKDAFICKGATFKIYKKSDGTYYLGK